MEFCVNIGFGTANSISLVAYSGKHYILLNVQDGADHEGKKRHSGSVKPQRNASPSVTPALIWRPTEISLPWAS
jgi:hypothetical protein